VYGVGDIEMALRRSGKGYVLGVNATHYFGSWHGKPVVAGTTEEIAKALGSVAWRRLSAGLGTKGERLHDWANLELADLEADEFLPGAKGLWTRRLLIRRHITDGEMAYFTTWCPPEQQLRRSLLSRDIAGPSRTASRPPRTSSA
jgi:SRSO17 transposase